MSDWFNDPFFDDGSRGSDIFGRHGGIFEEFDRMHRRMDKMMENAFTGFGGLGFDDSFGSEKAIGHDTNYNRRSSKPRVEEVGDKYSSSTTQKQPRVEEPDSDGEYPSPKPQKEKFSGGGSNFYAYSSHQVSTMNPDGSINMKRKDMDSTGKAHMAEMRKVGDKSVIYDRKMEAGKKPVDTTKHLGMTEAEIDEFNNDWERRKHSQLSFNSRSTPTNELGYSPKKSYKGHKHRH